MLECFYENLLSQKKEIARQQKLAEVQKQAIDDELRRREEAARDAELRDFEKTQTGFMPTSTNAAEKLTKIIDGKVFKGLKTLEGTIYIPDVEANDNNEKTEIYEKLKALEEKAKEKPKLPSFWLPSLTPQATPTLIEEPQKTLLCIASDPPHQITSLKKLNKVVFSTSTNPEDKKKSTTCPSCVKNLTNGSKLMVTKGCGHVVCKGCYTQFVKASGKCYVCNEKFKDSETIPLFVEGTGFAGSGAKVEVTRSGIAFQ
ncbi:hypothetical protein HDU67_008495 [Dinochytrium kinnereticum]|nr:hypothetical protein HDU67_008495 [Dinochytrium kinnereticum]